MKRHGFKKKTRSLLKKSPKNKEMEGTSDNFPSLSSKIESEVTVQSQEQEQTSKSTVHLITSTGEGSSKQCYPSTTEIDDIHDSDEESFDPNIEPEISLEYLKNTIFYDTPTLGCNIELRNKRGKWVKRKITKLANHSNKRVSRKSNKKNINKHPKGLISRDLSKNAQDFKKETKSVLRPEPFQYICQQLMPTVLMFSNQRKLIQHETKLKITSEEMNTDDKDVAQTSGEKVTKHANTSPIIGTHFKHEATSDSSFYSMNETNDIATTSQKNVSFNYLKPLSFFEVYRKPDEMSIPSAVAGSSTQEYDIILENECNKESSENFQKLVPEIDKPESSLFLNEYFQSLDKHFKLGGEIYLYNQSIEKKTKIQNKDQDRDSEDDEENNKRGPSASVTFKKQVIINKEDRDAKSKLDELSKQEPLNINQNLSETDERKKESTNKEQQNWAENKEQPIKQERRKSALRDSHSSIVSFRKSVTIQDGALPQSMFAKSSDDEDDKLKKYIPQAYTFDEAFDLAGYGRFNVYAQIACCFIYIYAHLHMGAYVYITALTQCEFHIKPVKRLTLENAFHIGVLPCGLIWGLLSDYYGRRFFIIVCTLLSLITTVASSLCETYVQFLFLRIITGCFLSGAMANVIVYVAEVHTQSRRDIAIARVIAGAAFIKVCACVLAWSLLPQTFEFSGIPGLGVKKITSWRVYMWTWMFFGLLGAFMFFFLPETPVHRHAEIGPFKALPLLALIYYRNAPKHCKDFPVNVLKTKSTNVRPSDHYLYDTLLNFIQIFNIFPVRRSLFILIYCKFMVSMLYFTIFKWIPGIYMAILENSEAYSNVCHFMNNVTAKASPWIIDQDVSELYKSNCSAKDLSQQMYGLLFVTESILLIPFVSLTCYINYYKKDLLFVVMMTPGAVATLLSILMPQALAAGMLVTFAMLSGCCTVMISGLLVDTFPADIRATVMGFMHLSSAVGSLIGALLLGWSESSNCNLLFLLISASAFGSIISMRYFWPDVDLVRKEMQNRGLSY